jgi:hypothetical protein
MELDDNEIKEKRRSYSPRKKKNNLDKKKKCGENICDYGQKENMDIDKYNMEVSNSSYEKNLMKIFDNIRKGSTYTIDNSLITSPKLFIRDILTKYVVKNIFNNRKDKVLIHIINKIMKSLYDKFYEKTGIKLKFVYRGGNILKLYKDEFENILPGKARQYFRDEFDKYFNISDIDFYTVIEDAEKLDSEQILKINEYLRILCYYGVYIARIFIMNNTDIFEFCKYNDRTLEKEFQNILDNINKDKKDSEYPDIKITDFIGLSFNNFVHIRDDKVKKVSNIVKNQLANNFILNVDDKDVYENFKKFGKSGRFDINITPKNEELSEVLINKIDYNEPNLFKDDFESDMKEIVSKNKILDFYITNNNEIYNKEEYINFSLVRLMINFLVIYERNGKIGFTNSSSELFDLSIGHPDDKMYNIYISNNIQEYEFRYNENKKDVIYIPKINTTILDLINILYEYRDYPWQDSKYEKRIRRLLVLIFVKESKNNNIDELYQFLRSTSLSNKGTGFDFIRYKNKSLKKNLPAKELDNYNKYISLYKSIINKLINITNKLHNRDI